MGFFSELGTGTLKAIELLISDEQLCKLLYYNTPDCLTKSPVTNPTDLIRTKIYPVPKVPLISTEAGSFINVFYDDITPNSRNSGFRTEVLKFTVIVHLDLYLIKDGIRPYEIMSRIDHIFNDMYYPEIAGHNLQPTGRVRMVQFDDNYFGYILSYGMANDSNIAGR
jgi:hypothetical protein